MNKLFKYIIFIFVIVLLLSGNAFTQDMESPMANFYEGLSDILERNMTTPDNAVMETDRFIKSNKSSLDRITSQIKKKSEEAKTNSYQHEMPSDADLEKAMEALEKSKMASALNRWMQVFMAFSMQHPEQAEQIGELMNQFVPQDQGD